MGVMHDRLLDLRVLRVWCSASILISTSVSQRDVGRLWRSLRVSPLDRAFPRAVVSIGPMLWQHIYGGAQLMADPVNEKPRQNLVGTRHWVLSPRCQCASMSTPPPQGAETEKGTNAPLNVGGLVTCSIDRGDIRVPEWVGRSPYTRGQLLADQSVDLIDPKLRFHWFPIRAWRRGRSSCKD